MMSFEDIRSTPIVSLVITCFNQGRFLREAVASIQRQTYPNIEIIVVDDGSTDDTRQVANSFQNVKYIYQENGGLSAARNLGIARSKGVFIVFLDADDILYPDAIGTNLNYLLQNPLWAFVSGGHDKVDEWLNPMSYDDEHAQVSSDHYVNLLRGNYIGMHASVMYRRTVLDALHFDVSLRACEDYDLYFRIARNHPVGSHPKKIAAYRHHNENMSRDYVHMLEQVTHVHARQLPWVKTDEEKAAWLTGKRTWKQYYAGLIYNRCFNGIEADRRWPGLAEMKIIATTMPSRFRDFVIKKTCHNTLSLLKRTLPDSLLRALHRAGLYKHYTPPLGKVQPGDFNRITPFSADFGFDRGGAIDRFYIEAFLGEKAHYVHGNVLEIGDNAYTRKFGDQKVLRSDVLHIDARNSQATYIGDITDVPHIPSAEFDCIIFTQTLHLIYDFKSALKTCYRILKPGGCLLLTVPGISHIDNGEWREFWLWAFTDTSIRKLLAETFNSSQAEVRTYGNVFVAAAFLYGMGLPEFRREFLFQHDPSYQVIISAAVVKS